MERKGTGKTERTGVVEHDNNVVERDMDVCGVTVVQVSDVDLRGRRRVQFRRRWVREEHAEPIAQRHQERQFEYACAKRCALLV